MYNLINAADIHERVKTHMVTLLNSFAHLGPNGKHQSLVFEPMGFDANDLLKGMADLHTETSPALLIRTKSILKQLLKGLHCLHSCQIAHGDLNPGNLLLTLRPLTDSDIPELAQHPTEDNISTPVKRIHSKHDRWAPNYLCLDQPLSKLAVLDGPVEVKLSDLGAGTHIIQRMQNLNALPNTDVRVAFCFGEAPKNIVTPMALRAPETILGGQIDHPIDLWNFGCLVYKFLTGNPLFQVAGFAGILQAEIDDYHLL